MGRRTRKIGETRICQTSAEGQNTPTPEPGDLRNGSRTTGRSVGFRWKSRGWPLGRSGQRWVRYGHRHGAGGSRAASDPRQTQADAPPRDEARDVSHDHQRPLRRTKTPRPGSRPSRRAGGVSNCVTMPDDGTRRHSAAHWWIWWTQPKGWVASTTSVPPSRGTGAILPIRRASARRGSRGPSQGTERHPGSR